MAGRRALVIASYRYADSGLRQLVAPAHDAEAFAAVLEDPEIAGFDVTTLVNEPNHVVGEAIADFYAGGRAEDLTLLYFTGHGLKDDEGRLYLAMTNTRREALMWTAISAAQLNEAMDASPSRRKVLILDCCYSGAFPAGRAAKADEGVQTLERFRGRGRAVLTASDATQYAFEGDDVRGSGTSSVFTRYLVEAIRSGEADLDNDGDIALDELYSYVYDRVVAEMPQQRPKRQEEVDGRIFVARNVHWELPSYLRFALESPIPAQRLGAVEGLAHLHHVGNHFVRASVAQHLTALADDDSRAVSAAAAAVLQRIEAGRARADTTVDSSPSPRTSRYHETARQQADIEALQQTGQEPEQWAAREAEKQARRKTEKQAAPGKVPHLQQPAEQGEPGMESSSATSDHPRRTESTDMREHLPGSRPGVETPQNDAPRGAVGDHRGTGGTSDFVPEVGSRQADESGSRARSGAEKRRNKALLLLAVVMALAAILVVSITFARGSRAPTAYEELLSYLPADKRASCSELDVDAHGQQAGAVCAGETYRLWESSGRASGYIESEGPTGDCSIAPIAGHQHQQKYATADGKAATIVCSRPLGSYRIEWVIEGSRLTYSKSADLNAAAYKQLWEDSTAVLERVGNNL